MKTRQENYMSMARAVAETLRHHEEEWKSLPKFMDCAAALNELLHNTDMEQTLAEISSVGVTIDKSLAAENAIDIGVKLSRRAIVYAVDTENHGLEHQLHISKSALLRGHQSIIMHKLEDVRSHLVSILPFLKDYGVVEKDLILLEEAIHAYNTMFVNPRQTIVERKGHNTLALLNLPAIRKVMHKMDNLINYFEPGKFAMDYHNARIIVDLGRRKSKEKKVVI